MPNDHSPIEAHGSASFCAFGERDIIDAHSHLFQDVPGLAAMLRANRVRVINICYEGSVAGKVERQEEAAQKLQQQYPDVFRFASSFDLTGRDAPDYAEQVITRLDASFRAGALMVKVWKDIGMEIRHTDGRFVMPDDPLFDPIYAFLAERGKPLVCHFAEPKAAWMPLDLSNPDDLIYAYYSEHPEWHMLNRPECPSYEELIAARDRLIERHPQLIVIGAHFGSMAHDVREVASRLDRYQNFYVDSAARTPLLAKQRAEDVRDFFIRYQDRILFGLDGEAPFEQAVSAEEAPALVERIEAQYRQDYQYYAGSGTMRGWGLETECLALPEPVLDKFYRDNALRVIPGLSASPRSGR